VKWLRRIEVIDRTFHGYFQSKKYTVQRRRGAAVETVVVGPMAVKCEVVRPRSGDVLGPGRHRLFGVAWAGEEAVARVAVSTDGGNSWMDADLIGPQAQYSWTMWEYLWEVGSPGEYNVLVRASSAGGRTQPLEHDLLNGGYLIHHSRAGSLSVVGRGRHEAEHADIDTLMWDMNAFAEENMRVPLDVEMEFTAGAGI
jgi:hypothetical protein